MKESLWLIEFLVKVFLESCYWDTWHTFENQCYLDFEQQHEFYNKKSMSHSFSSTLPVGKIWVYMARVYCPNSDFSFKCLGLNEQGTKYHCFNS